MPLCFTSATTPTTSIHGFPSGNILNRFPRGSSPGQSKSAMFWLTTATRGASTRSAEVNVRPILRPIPRAWKNPGVTYCMAATRASPTLSTSFPSTWMEYPSCPVARGRRSPVHTVSTPGRAATLASSRW